MRIYVHCEEPTIEIIIKNVFKNLLPDTVEFEFTVKSKPALINGLENSLEFYGSKWSYDKDFRVIIISDSDGQDCKDIKSILETKAQKFNLPTSTNPDPITDQFAILNLVIVEELESWFIGDIEALVKSYPKMPKSLHKQKGFRGFDKIKKPKEQLDQKLISIGYFKHYVRRNELAETLTPHMNPDSNQSASFQYFRRRLTDLVRADL
ncbi:MAG: DUF4276 family protein [Candidatus Pacebacteria bacterium]|nr:DUF4276 family protein [Candidatus Paceibacterota bacterium]